MVMPSSAAMPAAVPMPMRIPPPASFSMVTIGVSISGDVGVLA
jgi:hypothetical protein